MSEMSLCRATQWRTKDSAVVPISGMSDAHLRNAIRMLEGKYEAELAAAWGAAGSFDSGSMASYYACGQAEDVRPSPSLRYLRAELARREVKP